MRAPYVFSLLGAIGLAVACSSTPKPTSELVDTEASLRAANEIGAERVPEAQLHAKLAQEEVKRAHALMADDDNAEARRELEKAKADAELALALARRAEAQRAAQSTESSQAAPPQPSQQQVSMQRQELR